MSELTKDEVRAIRTLLATHTGGAFEYEGDQPDGNIPYGFVAVTGPQGETITYVRNFFVVAATDDPADIRGHALIDLSENPPQTRAAAHFTGSFIVNGRPRQLGGIDVVMDERYDHREWTNDHHPGGTRVYAFAPHDGQPRIVAEFWHDHAVIHGVRIENGQVDGGGQVDLRPLRRELEEVRAIAEAAGGGGGDLGGVLARLERIDRRLVEIDERLDKHSGRIGRKKNKKKKKNRDGAAT